MKKVLSLVALMGALTLTAKAQIQTPQPSPTAKLTQTVGLTEVTVDYSRPGMKGRAIFGDLVPFGTIWRTGANASTKITFSDDVKLGGKEIPAGTYALYSIPGETDWTIIVHNNLTLWGAGGYDEADDLVRFTVKPTKTQATHESFTIDIHSFDANKATISLMWENTKVDLPLEVNFNDKVMASIERTMAGPSANDYYAAANYYLSNGGDLNKASEWIKKAVDARPEAFWVIHVQAKIYAKMGKKDEALAAAKKSLEAAKVAADDFGYIANNERLIEEIKKM